MLDKSGSGRTVPKGLTSIHLQTKARLARGFLMQQMVMLNTLSHTTALG